MNSEKVKEILCRLHCKLLGDRKNEINHEEINCVGEVITLINELESENERLNKEIKAIHFTYETYNEKYIGQLKDLKKENQQLKDRIAELEKRCHFIWALGYDYDGCEKAESLKSLIDELVAISQGNWGDVCSKCENKQDNLIKDKLKQFAERLKEQAKTFQFGSVTVSNFLWVNDIDETLKEFINE